MSGVFFTKLYVAERDEILSVLNGIDVLVADMNGENVFNFVAPEKFALVIGNEANGVSAQVRKVATRTLRIPMQSTQESLNAAVAAGVSMYLLAKDAFVKE